MVVGAWTFIGDVLTWLGLLDLCAEETQRYPQVHPSGCRR